ncbi:MAG: 30S ribosomal protein S6 [Spirochaetes bacterium GWF1_31_7]|nr:MAG: 30S ribosomal protein S6 [Spirochaetes bacterium GWE1_32_154]OHD48997.1 MAG: 30S ribosomal protein S6 [Spirochaetes bacterium GWE2_31_10]OHD49563.1 MAG: 30S ribosomal protein S6 [Spirochaetes bacterium GWF1_31_7]HBD95907.1 30S ribosomal protein S6 [Spirochaetia bacterium]HBI36733.1 30S ribosomal protein S6 [Spirochaetia bacterium]
MTKYEMMIVFDEDELAFDQCKEFLYTTLKNSDVKITEEKDMGMKDLAYEINRKKRGHYYLLNIEADSKKLLDVQKLFKISKCVLRYINLNAEE